MLSNSLRLAWEYCWEERRYAHITFIRLTQIILMVFVITLSQTSASIQTYLADNLQNLLGADVVISVDRTLTQRQRQSLDELANDVVLTQSIQTTLTHKKQWQRATLKAVNADYPLQGELKTSMSLQSVAKSATSGPAAGEIWPDARLLASLGLQIGDKLIIAQQQFVVTRVLLHEPDRLMEGHDVSMRALIHSGDLAQLDFAADAVQSRYLLALDEHKLPQLLDWQRVQLPDAEVYHKQGKHPLALFWQRTENVIGLASIMLFFMAAIAMHQLTQVQSKKEQHFAAVCLSMGATRKAAATISTIKWIMHTLLLLPIVLPISLLCHWLMIDWMQETFAGLQWDGQFGAAGVAFAATAVLFGVFYLPVLLSITRASVAQLIHDTSSRVTASASLVCSLLVLILIAAFYSDNGLLTMMIVTAMASCVGTILLMNWLLLTVGERSTQRLSGLWPFALFMMKQRLVTKSTQILGVGLCAFLLLFTLMLMRDLGNSLAAHQRQHDGNLLVTQASAEQMDSITQWASNHAAQIRQNKPFVYGKLIAINGQSLAEFTDRPSDSLATLQRKVRMHWSESIPANNRLQSGTWWQAHDANWQQISLEQEIMTDLGLALGDQLSFVVGSQSFTFTLVASHVYRPGAGSITFWVQMPPAAVSQFGVTHYSMASIEVSADQFKKLGVLWQQHPTLRMVSLQEMTARFDSLLAMVTQLVSGFSMLIVGLAGVVIVASVKASEQKEKRKNSVILSFGFNHSTCLRLNLIEWVVTAMIAACGAIMGTWIAGVLIYETQFSLPYQPDPIWLIVVLFTIVSSVCALGWCASRKSLQASLRTLLAE